MSRNLALHRKTPTNLLAESLRASRLALERSKTLQLQGNQSMGLGVVEGYFAVPIPTTLNPQVETLTITAPSDTTIMIGNLMWSLFYVESAPGQTPTDERWVNKDNVAFYEDFLSFDVFLAYDSRDQGAGTLPSEADVFATIVGDNQARITAKLRSSSSWSVPGGSATYALVFFQIRATFI